MTQRLVAVMTAMTLLGTAPAVHAQATRAEADREERERKQQELAEPESGFLERTLKAVERSGVPLITRDGVYLKFGTLTTGSGFAFGGGYRSRRLLGRAAGVDAWAGMTASGYWETQARFQTPLTQNGRVVASVFGRYQDYPREDFFGLGPDALRAGFSDFRLKGPSVGGRADVRIARPAERQRGRRLSGAAGDRRHRPRRGLHQRDLRRAQRARARRRRRLPARARHRGRRFPPATPGAAAAAGIAPNTVTTPTATASTRSTGSTSICGSS